MRVLYVCNRVGFTQAQQIKILDPQPEDKLYIEGRGAENFERAVKSLRNGHMLEVAGGFRPLGDSPTMMLENLEPLDRYGKVIFDPEAQQRSDKHYSAMVRRFMARIRGEKSIGNRAPDIGRLGGLALAEKRRKARMPKERARKVWLDKKYERNSAALKHMPGWTEPTAYKNLGKSGRKPGRK